MAGRVMAVTQRHRDNMGRRGWHVFFFWEGGYLESPWWVPMAQRALCMVLFYKKDSANSSAAVKLSAVAFFTKLRGCSLLTCSVLSSGKKKLKNKFTGMLS